MNTKVVRIKEEEKTRETLEKNPGLLEAAEILKNGKEDLRGKRTSVRQPADRPYFLYGRTSGDREGDPGGGPETG